MSGSWSRPAARRPGAGDRRCRVAAIRCERASRSWPAMPTRRASSSIPGIRSARGCCAIFADAPTSCSMPTDRRSMARTWEAIRRRSRLPTRSASARRPSSASPPAAAWRRAAGRISRRATRRPGSLSTVRASTRRSWRRSRSCAADTATSSTTKCRMPKLRWQPSRRGRGRCTPTRCRRRAKAR